MFAGVEFVSLKIKIVEFLNKLYYNYAKILSKLFER